MRLRNKVLAVALATAMIVPAGVGNVFAADEKTTNVKYVVTQSYEWSIHSEIDFGNDAGINKTVKKAENEVKVSKNVIPDRQKLNIKVKGSGTQGEFQIMNGSTVLNYTITDGDKNIDPNGDVLNVNAGTNEGNKNLTFALSTTKETAEVAGDYVGTVTYTASIVGQ